MGGLESAREAEGPCAERGESGETDAGFAFIRDTALSVLMTMGDGAPPECTTLSSFILKYRTSHVQYENSTIGL